MREGHRPFGGSLGSKQYAKSYGTVVESMCPGPGVIEGGGGGGGRRESPLSSLTISHPSSPSPMTPSTALAPQFRCLKN